MSFRSSSLHANTAVLLTSFGSFLASSDAIKINRRKVNILFKISCLFFLPFFLNRSNVVRRVHNITYTGRVLWFEHKSHRSYEWFARIFVKKWLDVNCSSVWTYRFFFLNDWNQSHRMKSKPNLFNIQLSRIE